MYYASGAPFLICSAVLYFPYPAATMFPKTCASVASVACPCVMTPSYQIPPPHGELSPPRPSTMPPCFFITS